MTLFASFAQSLPTIGGILAAMAVIASIETLIPLHARGRQGRAHLGPNLALTFITFGTNALFSAALVIGLVWLEARSFGLSRLALPAPLTVAIALLWLDFAFYVTHVAMHKLPAFWRYHRVHHSDPAVDVTTTIRQHPGEGVIRYAFLALFALALGVPAGAFAVYRAAVALNGLLEHANLRAPLWLDRALSLVTTWPYMHKVHHSRLPEQTDSNYGNLFSMWDRLFGTFTPSCQGASIAYGLAGFDDAATQTTAGLLELPYREPGMAGIPAAARAQ